MKNIGIDIRMFGNQHGGIGRYVFELVKNILELDQENNYFLFYNEDNESEIDLLRMDWSRPVHARIVEFVPVNIRHYSLAEQIRLPRILDKYNLDLTHFPNFNVPIRYKKPFVVTIHDVVHHKISGAKKSRLLHFYAYKKVIENAAKNSKKIITVSEFSKRDIANYFQVPLDKIVTTYEGTSLENNVSEKVVAEVKKKYLLNRPYLLFVGVLERKKNIISLTRALDVLIKNYGDNIDLVIAGKPDKHYPDIKYKAMDIKNQDRLVFTDYVSDQDLTALYKGATAFVSASLHEGFGLPGVEAMKFGLPLAVSNIEVFNEIYDDSAIYFNSTDVNDIAEKMHLLASDNQFNSQMRIKSLRRAEMFDWKKTAGQTLQIYKELL